MRGIVAPQAVKKKRKKVLNDVTNRDKKPKNSSFDFVDTPKLGKIRAPRKNQFWKSSKMNSRIKTMISKNGRIQMILDKEGAPAHGETSPQEVSKYFKIRNHGATNPTNPSLPAQSANPPIKITIPKSPPIKLKIPKSPPIKLKIPKKSPPLKLKIPKSRISPESSKIILTISKRKLKKLKKLKKAKKQREKKVKPPKKMKIKYKNLYGRVIEYAKNLQPDE